VDPGPGGRRALTQTRNKLRETLFVMALLGLALGLVRHSARNPGDIGPLDRALLHIIGPAQATLARAAHGLGQLFVRYVALVNIETQNRSLRQENLSLRTQLADAKRITAEAERLRRLLALRESLSPATVAARVVAMDASPYFRVARVRIELADVPVVRGMPVIAHDGVVGRIDRVIGSTADVQLAVDPASAIHVLLPRTGARGILVGRPGSNSYRCDLQYVARGEPTRVGDVVVTSGVGEFPRDFPVGTVSQVVQSRAGLFQEVQVTPHVDFARLSEVLVVVAPGQTAEPQAGPRNSSAPAPARGLSLYR
jgi:rod shape-determining protein MreC